MSDKPEGKKGKLRDSEKLNKTGRFIWDYRIEFFSGVFVLIGLILAFFYIHIGAALVGLGFGVCFYEEMHNYFVQIRDLYIEKGVFKSLVLIGTIIYFLIVIPLFLITAAVGYGAMYLIRGVLKK